MNRIYLDHTATTPLDPRVFEAMVPYFTKTFGNASSVHSYGREARQALEKARKTVADAIGAAPAEIFFTSGGTESNNLALRGVASAARKPNRIPHIVTSAAEHHSVLEPCEHLQDDGCRVSFLRVDEDALISADQIGREMSADTCLVSIMTANNEVGSLSPLGEVAGVCRANGILFHTDAVQALGKIPLNVDSPGVDLMSLSAHKIYGPKGIGALYIRRGTEIDPLTWGGGQERGRRPGTESVPLAVGFARAVELAVSEMQEEAERLASLRDELEKAIRAVFPGVLVNGHSKDRLPHILNISFDSTAMSLEGEMLLVNMDLAGVALASGSACTSGSVQPSHVLLAMGRDKATAKATLRFAFGKSNSPDDVPVVVEALRTSVKSAGHTDR